MMADQPPSKAMLDQPSGAIRALKAVTAGAAQSKGRIAAAIQKQQRLFPGGEGLGEGDD
jgi:hypothetical protein